MSEELEVDDIDDVDGEQIVLGKITEAYINIRDARAELKNTFEERDATLKGEMDLLQEQMLGVCKQFDCDSIRTKAGTIIRSIKTRYWTNDWESMHKFIHEHNAFPLLEKRLHQTNMKQFLEDHPEILPEGLNMDREFTIVVRRVRK
jgi:hypothetical protein